MNILILFTSLFVSIKNFTADPFNTQPADVSKEQESSAFEDLKKPLYFDPQNLQLKFSDGNEVNLEIEEIGLDSEEDQLEAPKNWNNAGWYYKSAKPGENGNVIIDGHYDNNYGNPAAFWSLKNIGLSDKVILNDKLNRNFTYKVTDTFYVDIDDPNRLQVFKDNESPTLTLITCGGIWDYESGTYNKRLVVKAELISSDLESDFLK